MDVLDFETCTTLLRTCTGIGYDPDDLQTLMAEAVNRDRELNKRFGITRKDDTLPERFRTEALKTGPTKGSTVDIQRMVDEYYRLHGWDD
jgi:aldehyde:ferredoxin oxidoreductase